MLHGTESAVGAEPLCGLNCHIRLGWLRLRFVRFLTVRLLEWG
jgi:hypothetical protein